MKYLVQTLFLFFALLLAFCKHPEQANPSNCLADKIEAFKQVPWAQSIVKISRPNDTLYWFVDSIADGGEEVLDENCELVCVADCECIGNIEFCDETHFNFPMEIIWEK
ncbi:MAG: hypothetical protein H7246_00990 [Phycisphaerae bacterium]|nr:hypothetical protein [Saprospiraceae bacterium]